MTANPKSEAFEATVPLVDTFPYLACFLDFCKLPLVSYAVTSNLSFYLCYIFSIAI